MTAPSDMSDAELAACVARDVMGWTDIVTRGSPGSQYGKPPPSARGAGEGDG